MDKYTETPPPVVESTPETVELPAPTSWPMVLGFGVALIFAGLATSLAMSAIGALLAIPGMVGWARQVLPHSAHERVPVTGEVPEVNTTRSQVEQVAVAAGLVRAKLPLELYPISAGVRGGLAGGAAMAVLAILYGIVSGHGIWYPINLLAAGFFPSATTAQLSAFYPSAFAIAVVIHLVTSILVGVLYGALTPMMPNRPILLGGLIAPLVWSGLLYSSLAIINPTLSERIDWGWFVLSQIGFGVVAGLVVSRRERVALLQPIPWSLRAGIEATGLADESSKGQDHD
ncbi:MAG TPA: hypothetical protein VKE22_04330 [Haliangiales bacterium]|nr:hypothetical protein [Haliangiales bacterium]